MDNTSTPTKITPPEIPLCCSPSAAWEWARCLAELAVIYGDDDALAALPSAVDHFLAALRQAEVPWGAK